MNRWKTDRKNANESTLKCDGAHRSRKKSINTIAWKLYEELTPQVGLSYLENMHFSRLDAADYVPATALGGFTNGVSPLEMAAGYAALANDGMYREPTCIMRITDDTEGKCISLHWEGQGSLPAECGTDDDRRFKGCIYQRYGARTGTFRYAVRRKDGNDQRPQGRLAGRLYEILHDQRMGWIRYAKRDGQPDG